MWLYAERGPTMLTFFMICVLLFGTGFITSSVVQKKVLESFSAGQNVSLECFISQKHENYFSWFKQTLGEAPTCIASLYVESSTPVFYGDFNNDSRLEVQKKKTSFVLTIKKAKPSDSGIYYCGARDYDLITFSNGLYLNYKDASSRQYNIKESLSRLDSDAERQLVLNPGDSVNLHCSVLTERCEVNHSIYWFRHKSGDTHPGLVYKHGENNGQCEKSSHLQSCVYNLPKDSLSLSDAGIYYCAVATCGEILFGNGSRLDIREPRSKSYWTLVVPVLASTNILSLLIITILLCKRAQKRQETFSETQALQTTFSSSPANEGVPEEISYAAVHFSGRNRHETEESSTSHVIYSTARGYSAKK